MMKECCSLGSVQARAPLRVSNAANQNRNLRGDSGSLQCKERIRGQRLRVVDDAREQHQSN